MESYESQDSDGDETSDIREGKHMLAESVFVKFLRRQTDLFSIFVCIQKLYSEDLIAIMDAVQKNSHIRLFELDISSWDGLPSDNRGRVQVASLLLSGQCDPMPIGQLIKRTDVKALRFQVKRMSDTTLSKLCKTIRNHEKLGMLTIHYFEMRSEIESLQKVMDVVIKGQKIKHLKLNCEHHLGDIVFHPSLEDNTTLKTLRLKDMGPVANSEKMLIFMQKLVCLKDVKFDANGLEDKQIRDILRAIYKKEKLNKLELAGCGINEKTCTMVKNILSTAENPLDLTLLNTTFDHELAQSLFDSLEPTCKLKELVLEENNFAHIKPTCFGNLLINLPHLIYLNLTSTHLNESTLGNISSGMCDNHNLRTLRLSHNNLRGVSIAYLCKCLAINTQLSHLDISWCKLNRNDWQHVVNYIKKTKTLRVIDLLGNRGSIPETDFEKMIHEAFSLNYSLTDSDLSKDHQFVDDIIPETTVYLRPVFDRNEKIHAEIEALRLRVLIVCQVIFFGKEKEGTIFGFSILPEEVKSMIFYQLVEDRSLVSYKDILKIMKYASDRKNIIRTTRQEFKDIFTREKGQKRKL